MHNFIYKKPPFHTTIAARIVLLLFLDRHHAARWKPSKCPWNGLAGDRTQFIASAAVGLKSSTPVQKVEFPHPLKDGKCI